MEICRKLFIRCGDEDRLQALLAEISRNLPPGWSRLEARGIFGEESGNARDLCIFRWDGGDRYPAFELTLVRQGTGICSVGMVGSPEPGHFTLSDSNAAVVEFEKIARSAVERLGMEIELTSDRFDIYQELSKAAAEKLRVFSRSANKGLGGALPVDHERWLDFVVTAHRDGSKLPALWLREWLIEDEGWYFDDADRLAGEYAFGGEILSYSERQTA